jgi:ankyrin repeat protein
LAERLQQAMKNPLLARQLASMMMLDEMERLLIAGDVESIRLWLDAGVDVDIATENGWSPLLITCWQGHVALVRLLLDAGANKEKASNTGATPLFMAARRAMMRW